MNQHLHGDATVANQVPSATPPSPDYKNNQHFPSDTVVAVAPVAASNDMAEARHDAIHALAHDLKFSLTIAEAQSLFKTLRRRVPSERSIQRYCNDGLIAGQLIRTTYGREWLLNESSLVRYIEKLPLVGSVDNVANQVPSATPPSPIHPQSQQNPPDSPVTGDATVAKNPPMTSVAELDDEEPPTVGETRSRADILLENAKLLAMTEGKDAVIQELKEDQAFLREEVRDSRAMKRDVTRISEKMLTVMQSIATASRALKAPENTSPIHVDSEPASRG